MNSQIVKKKEFISVPDSKTRCFCTTLALFESPGLFFLTHNFIETMFFRQLDFSSVFFFSCSLACLQIVAYAYLEVYYACYHINLILWHLSRFPALVHIALYQAFHIGTEWMLDMGGIPIVDMPKRPLPTLYQHMVPVWVPKMILQSLTLISIISNLKLVKNH